MPMRFSIWECIKIESFLLLEGCVFAELMLGQPIFPGDSGVDQLVEIIKVLGTPTREQASTCSRITEPFLHKLPVVAGEHN